MKNKKLTFESAISAVKKNKCAYRSGWNGKDMFIFLVPGSEFAVSRKPLLGIFNEGTKVKYRPHIDIKQADGALGVWQPSMGDVMANDWFILKEV